MQQAIRICRRIREICCQRLTAITERLSMLDSENADLYRKNLAEFELRWQDAINAWEQKAAPLRGYASCRLPPQLGIPAGLAGPEGSCIA